MAKTLAQIQTELCQSGIGKLGSGPALLQAIAQLYDDAAVSPPVPEGLFVDLQGYWNGTSPNPDYGSIVPFNASGAMTWGDGPGPNGGGAASYMGVSTGNLEVTNDGFGSMIETTTTINVFVSIIQTAGLEAVIFSKTIGQFGLGYVVYFDPTSSSNDYVRMDMLDADCTTSYIPTSFDVGSSPEWVMLTLVMRPDKGLLYYNGNLVMEQAGAYWCATATHPFKIGGYFGFVSWDGWISNLGYWTRELTPAEITQLYNGGLGLTASEL